MREQNDLTKTLGGNPSQISTRVSVDSHYICLKKKKNYGKEFQLTFTHLLQAERISIILFYLMYSHEVPFLVE